MSNRRKAGRYRRMYRFDFEPWGELRLHHVDADSSLGRKTRRDRPTAPLETQTARILHVRRTRLSRLRRAAVAPAALAFPVAVVAVRRCRPYFVTVGSSFVAGRFAAIDRMGTLPPAHSQVGSLRPARQTQLGAPMTRGTNAEVAGFAKSATSSSAAPNLKQARAVAVRP